MERIYPSFLARQVVMVVLLLLLLLQLGSWHGGVIVVYALVPCDNSNDCERILVPGSECLETGFCSNAFYKGGCLSNMMKSLNGTSYTATTTNNKNRHLRACSSADPSEAETLGYCVSRNDWNYTEIRLMGNNWESVFFETWIVQILLSEMLGVPTSVDTGMADTVVDFYNNEGRMEYGKGYDWDAIRMASKVGDCRLVKQSDDPEDYQSCAHVSLEVWEGQLENMKLLQNDNVAEKPTPLGVLGDAGWYIPKFTAEKDPGLLAHFGLSGDENRRKLAETFLRPTKWIDYCNEVSTTNCSQPDDVAQRAPELVEEENMMFLKDSYTGYFRKTIENDCDTYPLNCTGNIVDYPCGWSSFVQQQTYHLDIALQSSGDEPVCRGYTYNQMVEIWHAANMTKSNVVMIYWTPDSLVQLYAGTDAEFQKVTLPQPTQECFDHRVSSLDRCGPDLQKRIGGPLGACDDQPQTLMKVISTSLYDISHPTDISDAIWSPAYELIQNFEMSGLQIGVLFEKWLQATNDANQTDRIIEPREAVCQWVVQNYDLVQSFIPRTYPRVIETGEHPLQEPMFYISWVFGIAALVLIFFVSGAVYHFRERRVMNLAQIEFLFCLLAGLTLVQFGSFALTLPPSNVSCIVAAWAVNLGYTLELVPLIVKISAINTLMAAARRMKRIKINRFNLFLAVAMFAIMMTIFLIIWTIMDPPTKTNHYELTDTVNNEGETIVLVYSFCQTEKSVWVILTLVWRFGLLLWATVLAVQTRKCPVNYNESKILAILIYSQFLFLVWMIILYLVSTNDPNMARYASLIQSIDVASACCIYFLPKIFTTDENFQHNRQRHGNNNLHQSVSGMQQTEVSQDMFDTSPALKFESSKFERPNTTPPIIDKKDLKISRDAINSNICHAGSNFSDRYSSLGSNTTDLPQSTTSDLDDKQKGTNVTTTTTTTTTNVDFPILSDFHVNDDCIVGTIIYQNKYGELNKVTLKRYNHGEDDMNDKCDGEKLHTPLILQQIQDIMNPIEERRQSHSENDGDSIISELSDSHRILTDKVDITKNEERIEVMEPSCSLSRDAVLQRLVGKTTCK
jgi:7 transmembrane sweet-taste receptor of 3 GCPR